MHSRTIGKTPQFQCFRSLRPQVQENAGPELQPHRDEPFAISFDLRAEALVPCPHCNRTFLPDRLEARAGRDDAALGLVCVGPVAVQ